MNRLLSVLGAAGMLALAMTGSAVAHQGHEGELSIISGISPDVEGVTVDTVPGGLGKLKLSTSGPTTAIVFGSSQQPIFRSGPGGVEANVSSPEWYRDNEPLGIAQVPGTAKPGAAPRWVKVSAGRSWEWFDHRLHGSGSRVARWEVPIEVDGKRAEIRGRNITFPAVLQVRVSQGRPLPGVQITPVDKPNSLKAVNTGKSTVTILGPDGEDFARLGPKGTEVNVHSRAWLSTAQYRNRDLLESQIDPRAKPKWLLLSPQAELIWPDPGLVPEKDIAAAVEGLRTPTEVGTWSIAMKTDGGETGEIGGRVLLTPGTGEKDPPAGGGAPVPAATSEGFWSSGITILLAIAATIALLLGGFLVLRSRA